MNMNITNVFGFETVDSYTLKDALGISSSTKHATWVERAIKRARLIEGEDYVVSTYGTCGSQSTTASKINDGVLVYHFGLDAVEMIAMLTDSDVGHKVRKQMQSYKQAYLMTVKHQVENQANIIKTLGGNGSLSSQAKNAGYRTALEMKDVLALATGSSAIKRIAKDIHRFQVLKLEAIHSIA